MNNFTNIEELYKRLCETTAETPPIEIWSRIEASLDEKQRRAKIVWLRRFAVAASLTLLVSLSTMLWFFTDTSNNNTILTKHEIIDEKSANETENQTETHHTKVKETEIFDSSHKMEKVSVKETESSIIKNDDLLSESNKLSFNESIFNIPSINLKSSSPETPQFNTYTEEASEKLNEEKYFANDIFHYIYPEQDSRKKQTATRIEVGGSFSPVYSFRNSSVENNPYFPEMKKDVPDEKGIIHGGGGLNVNVRINSKWSVESGVKYAKLGHKITNPETINSIFTAEGNGSTLVINQVSLGNTMGIIHSNNSYERQFNDEIIPTPPGMATIFDEDIINKNIEQNLDYLEVPVSFRYYLTDKKFSLSLSAGFSANFLINNSFYLKYNNNREKIGKTDGISGVTMSSHAGLSIGIPLFKRFSLQVEPRINYFLQEINKDYIFKYRPYSFGVYSGIKYEFGK